MVESKGDPIGERWLVRDDEAGARVDGFLAKRAIFPSTAAARRAIASGIARVNGRAAKKGVRLAAGDVVSVEEGELTSAILQPTPTLELPVLHLDDMIVALDKPPNLASHPLRPSDGPTVASALVAMFPECTHASPDPREGGLAHRLDIGTSGVLLAARSQEAWYRLREALASASCEKTYLAEVQGSFPLAEDVSDPFIAPGPVPSSFVIEAAVGRQGRRSGKVQLGAGRQPLPARTEVRLVEKRENSTLAEAKLARGRAHQVRAHLAHLGTPVVGDAVYGNAAEGSRLHLHAWAVSFVHPGTGQLMRIESPLPAWAVSRS